jgi:restriction endonuclease Mrr
MSEPTLEELDAIVDGLNSSHRPFALPRLRALYALGGSAPAKEAKAKIDELLQPHLSPAQLAYLDRNSRHGWARFELKGHGLVDGSRPGVWALTETGRRYAEAHADAPLEVPTDLPTEESAAQSHEGTETVPVTLGGAYVVPVLDVLGGGPMTRSTLTEAVEPRLAGVLLPGDRRTMPNGKQVWSYRLGWTMNQMRSDGLVETPRRALWAITEKGRDRLAADRDSWNIESYQGTASARVLSLETAGTGGTTPSTHQAPAPSRPWSSDAWTQLKAELGPHVFEALSARLRPDLGPTPSTAGRAIARNVVLYGPPGTGKTHVAKRVANALAGSDDGDASRQTIVQFHPSYTYEDFIQRGATFDTASRRALEMDVFLPSLPEGPVVVDAKYKTHVSSSNLHQMVAYCHMTGARRAVLVFPSGHVSSRDSYFFDSPGSTRCVTVDVVELDTTATTIAGWRRAGVALLAAATGPRPREHQ